MANVTGILAVTFVTAWALALVFIGNIGDTNGED